MNMILWIFLFWMGSIVASYPYILWHFRTMDDVPYGFTDEFVSSFVSAIPIFNLYLLAVVIRDRLHLKVQVKKLKRILKNSENEEELIEAVRLLEEYLKMKR